MHISSFIIWLYELRRAIGAADAAVFRAVNSELACPALDFVMRIATLAGVGSVQAGLCLILILIGLIFERVHLRRAGYAGLIAFAYSGIAVQVAKILWNRPRPLLAMYDVRFVDTPRFAHSFPSGHTTTAFAVAVAVSIMLPRSRWVLIPLAILAAVSRVYLGVHFPLDVIFGGVLGSVLGIAATRTIYRKKKAED